MDVILTDQNFEGEVLQSRIPVLVDFWASWCGPCQMVGPIVSELAKEYEGKLKVGKMNVDENQVMPGKYNIMSIPSLLLFKGGEVVDTMIGAMSKENFKKRIDGALNAN